jgi:hypothetical protein
MIGVLVPPRLPPEDLVGYAQRAEQLGFPEVWLAEDCFLHGAFVQAATILASTSSLHVGIVTLRDTRIAEITSFLEPSYFAASGLPAALL